MLELSLCNYYTTIMSKSMSTSRPMPGVIDTTIYVVFKTLKTGND